MTFIWTPAAVDLLHRLLRDYGSTYAQDPGLDARTARRMIEDGWRPTEEVSVFCDQRVPKGMSLEDYTNGIEAHMTCALRQEAGEKIEGLSLRTTETENEDVWDTVRVRRVWTFRVAKPLDDKRYKGDD